MIVLPLQDHGAPILTGRPRADLEMAAHVVFPGGMVLAGPAAFRELCRFLPGGWLPRAVLHLPGALSLAERAYRWVVWQWGPVGGWPRRG